MESVLNGIPSKCHLILEDANKIDGFPKATIVITGLDCMCQHPSWKYPNGFLRKKE